MTGQVATLRKYRGRYVCALCEKKLREAPPPKPPAPQFRYYCTSCSSYFNNPGAKGSGLIEVILYIFMIVPGLIYSVWRRSGNTKLCPKCSSSALIDSNAGTHVRCPDCKELVLSEATKCRHCGCSLVPQK